MPARKLQITLLTELVRLAQVTTVHKSSAVKNERDKISLQEVQRPLKNCKQTPGRFLQSNIRSQTELEAKTKLVNCSKLADEEICFEVKRFSIFFFLNRL